MQARQSSVMVSYNGRDITKTITDYVEGFQYVDHASGTADTVSLKLNDRSGKWSGGWIPVEGDYVEATIVLTNWTGAGDNRKYRCGYFLVDDLSFSGPPSVATIGGIATPIRSDFNVTEKSKTWKKTSVKGILTQITGEAEIGLHFSGQDYPVDELEQSGKTNQAFAYELCSSYNLAMKLYNKKMVVFDQTDYEDQEASLTIDKTQCSGWDIRKGMTVAYDGVSISYTDPKTSKTLSYKFLLRDGGRIMKVNETVENLQDAEIKAKAKLLAHNRQCQTMNVKLRGDVRYVASKCVNISGFGKLDGKYYIDSVTHEKNAGSGYTCSLEMHSVIVVKGVTVATVQSGDTTKKASDSGTKGKTYTVVSGDTLWKISSQLLGSGANYMQIYNANSTVIESAAKAQGKSSSSNGHWIYPGMTLTIPG